MENLQVDKVDKIDKGKNTTLSKLERDLQGHLDEQGSTAWPCCLAPHHGNNEDFIDNFPLLPH